MAFRLHGPPPPTLAQLPRLLARLRAERRVSQRQLADAAGVERSVLRRAESGRDTQLSTWVKLFDALGYRVEVDWFDDEERGEVLDGERGRRWERQRWR